MKDFIGTVRFKILVGILLVMAGFMIMAVYTGGTASLLSQAVSAVTVPIQRVSSSISGGVTEFFSKYVRAGQVYDRNAELQEEVNALRQRLVDYEQIKHENEQLREILGVMEARQDLTVETAAVIARDPADTFFYSFTIDKGSLHNVKLYDPIMTADGLVGYVREVGLNSSKVVTLLDVSINVGAKDSSTRDTGIVTGTVDLAEEGLCMLEYLSRESEVAVGDIVTTSGGSLFPKDLIIGEIVEVRGSSRGTSLEAIIKPAADITIIKDVFVITHFEGQGEE